jgi:histidinol dehydrogenase
MLELIVLRSRVQRLEPRRLEIDPSVAEAVRDIVERTRVEGDAALFDLTLRFDGADLRERGIVMSPEELAAAFEEVPVELGHAIDGLIARITELHRKQVPREWVEERDGVWHGEIVRPLRRVGCYVPGGRAVYPSSVAMTVVPAIVAGVEEVIVCTPPRQDGSVHAAVRYAAAKAGAARLLKVGGAQAIAAMAFGTNSIPAVDRVVGPGNVYVTEAKRQLAGIVGIDGLAGPTELVVVADGLADARFLAFDLIAQAEHDPQASTTLITTDPPLLERVAEAVKAGLARAGRREIVDQALAQSRAVLVADLEDAVEVIDELAPEHLEVVMPNARQFATRVRSAGAIFLGPWTTVPFGDYGVASNHVLPTAGTARFASGLRAADFVTVASVVELTQAAAVRLAPEVATIARDEGLVGHARAVEIRTESNAEAHVPS